MSVHVAVVYAADGIRLLAAARTRAEVVARVARYVERQAMLLLHPDDAARVRELLAAGRDDEAVARYFASVGARWEKEFLHHEVVGVACFPTGALSPGASHEGARDEG